MRDAEHVRHALVPKNNFLGKWSILGQSFGGFAALTYLSIANEGWSNSAVFAQTPSVLACFRLCAVRLVLPPTFPPVLTQLLSILWLAGLMEVLLTGGIPPHINKGLGCEAAYPSLLRRLMQVGAQGAYLCSALCSPILVAFQ